MDITLRIATLDDLPTLKALIPDSAQALSKNFYTPEQVEALITYVIGVDTQLIADETYFVAESGGQIVGCGGWSKRKTMYGGDQMKAEADPILDPKEEAARIRAFFIHPDWGRQRIGTRIIQACEEAAIAAGYSRMELVATAPGEPLYKALDYEVTERFDQSVPGGILLPFAHMKKQLV